MLVMLNYPRARIKKSIFTNSYRDGDGRVKLILSIISNKNVYIP